jgi:hypothetical protein
MVNRLFAVPSVDVFRALRGVLRGKLAMRRRNARRPRRNGLLHTFELTAPHDNSIFVDSSFPLLTLLNKMHANMARCIVALHGFIATVFRIISKAEFAYTVIVSNAIFVVNLIWSPVSRHIKPCQNMRRVVKSLPDLYFYVAIIVARSGLLPRISLIPTSEMWDICSLFPCEYPSFWAVMQNRSDEIRRQSRQSIVRHTPLHLLCGLLVSLSQLSLVNNRLQRIF